MSSAQREQDTASIAWIGAIGVMTVVACVFALQAIYLALQNADDVRKADVSQEYRSVLAEGTAKVGEYAYVDRAKGIVRIPIEEAMKLVVTERQQTQQAGDLPSTAGGEPIKP